MTSAGTFIVFFMIFWATVVYLAVRIKNYFLYLVVFLVLMMFGFGVLADEPLTCPPDVDCLEWFHQQDRDFWERYQDQSTDLRNNYDQCVDIKNEFGDWINFKRSELFFKSRRHNPITGYIPHGIVEETSTEIQYLFDHYMADWRQITGSGANPDACLDVSIQYSHTILGMTEKFPPPEPMPEGQYQPDMTPPSWQRYLN